MKNQSAVANRNQEVTEKIGSDKVSTTAVKRKLVDHLLRRLRNREHVNIN